MATPTSLHAVLALTVLTLLTSGVQPRPLTPAESRQLDRFVMEVMRCGRMPALSVSLVGDGEVVYEQGYGTANPTTRVKTTRDTAFCLGSSTQAFSAVLLSALLSYKENKTWDTPLHDIIGSHVHLPGRFRTEFVNLKDVLGMRTGISNMDFLATAIGYNRYRVVQNLRFAPEVAGFREENVFSEILFPLVEDAARALGGDTWYKLIRQYLFSRLGMDHTSFLHVDAKDDGTLATPVHGYSGKMVPVPMDAFKGQEIVAAASSVCASASDMSKWISFVLSGGKNLDGDQVMAQEALTSTFRPVQSRGEARDTREAGFTQPTLQVSYTRESNALGWIRGQYRGYNFVSQDGSLPGYESLTTILPTRNVGVFTAFTGDGGARAYAAKTLVNMFGLDLVLHGQPWFDQNSVCDLMDRMVDETLKSEPTPDYVGRQSEAIRPLSAYVGTYRHYGFGDVRVTQNDTGLLSLEYGELGRYILHPSQRNDTFTMHAGPGPLWYTTHVDEYRNKGPYLAIFSTRHNDANGHVTTVTIPHFARDMDPEFSKYPVKPRSFTDDLQQECDVSTLVSASLVLVSLAAGVAMGLVR